MRWAGAANFLSQGRKLAANLLSGGMGEKRFKAKLFCCSDSLFTSEASWKPARGSWVGLFQSLLTSEKLTNVKKTRCKLVASSYLCRVECDLK